MDDNVGDYVTSCRFRERLAPGRMTEIPQRVSKQTDKAGLLNRAVRDSTENVYYVNKRPSGVRNEAIAGAR